MRGVGLLVVGALLAAACAGSDSEPAASTSAAPTAATTTSIPVASTVAATTTVPEPANLSLTATVTASAFLADNPPRAAIDGNEATWWGAGEHPVQWLDLDLGAAATLAGIRLVASQDPPGPTVHNLYLGASPDELELVETLARSTADLSELEVTFDPPHENIRHVRIETTDSPSWVGWREVEVFGFASGEPPAIPADLVFINGDVVTMDASLSIASALAVAGDRIVAVGTEAEVREAAAPDAAVVDLEGRALLPGFIDPHTHLFNDAWRLDTDLAGAQQLALENGLTTLSNMFTPQSFFFEMQDFYASGQLRVRTHLYLLHGDNCGNLQGEWWRAHPPTTTPGEMFRIGGVKLFADGGSCGRPAVTVEVVAGDGLGDLWFDEAELTAEVRVADEAGYQVVIHAIGDLAIETAQNALDNVLAGRPNVLRHRIDHNEILRDDLLARYSEVGIVAVVFGSYPTCWTDDRFPITEEWKRLAWRWRDLFDANPGLHIAWHGDDPWVPPISPLAELFNLVTRKAQADDGSICNPPPWLAAQAITVEEGLVMMTREAAYAIGRDDELGSLEAGKLADLVVLDANPLAVPSEGIIDIEVLMTVVGGRVEYCAPGTGEWCSR